MTFLTPEQRQTLHLICDTLIPALPLVDPDEPAFYGLAGSDLELAAALEANLLVASSEANRTQLQMVLNLLESAVFNGLSVRLPYAFRDMTLEERTSLLRSWANSPLPAARQFFQSLKRLALFLFYSMMPAGRANPAWEALGYPEPPAVNPPVGSIRPLMIDQPTTLSTDVLVIGSGAGGGVVAGELSAAGQDVLVVEKGGYYAEQDFNGRELDSQKLYERRGLLTTSDLSMSILAGSTLGGGTTVNWTASLATPAEVLHEWEREYGFSGASGAAFQASVRAVSERLNVGREDSQITAVNRLLEAGCKALDYRVEPIPRNAKGCGVCDFCNFGCASGGKQSTLRTYLQDAHERGARILVKAQVERVLIERGEARGALVDVEGADGRRHRVTIRAKTVVVAAGAIHTPAILMRSGLLNHNIGANLHLHPVTVIYGQFEEMVKGWEGPPMTRLSPAFANLDGRGYGVRLETAPAHPGITAAALPWQSGAAHKRLMQRMPHLANIIVLTRDRYGGRVRVDGRGEPVVDYRLHPYDARHLMRGLVEALRVHIAAGAVEVSSPHTRPLIYRPGVDGSAADYLKAVEARGFQPNAYALFSAHQMSSCRIGGNSARGAVDPSGESYEARGLYVMDGSVLPSASGVNPMLSIMSVAHFLAQQLKTRLV